MAFCSCGNTATRRVRVDAGQRGSTITLMCKSHSKEMTNTSLVKDGRGHPKGMLVSIERI
jgi:hypothetical protein